MTSPNNHVSKQFIWLQCVIELQISFKSKLNKQFHVYHVYIILEKKNTEYHDNSNDNIWWIERTMHWTYWNRLMHKIINSKSISINYGYLMWWNSFCKSLWMIDESCHIISEYLRRWRYSHIDESQFNNWTVSICILNRSCLN